MAFAPHMRARSSGGSSTSTSNGVSRAFPCTVEEAWALLTSEAGMAAWLGVGAVLEPVPGAAYTAADGTAGEVRSFRPYDRIRLTWRPPG